MPVELTDRCLSVTRSVDLEALIDDVQAVAVELDITAEGPVIEASVTKGLRSISFGRIDALINNAGVR
nr:glucose/ribitol dehydrogenase [Tanacetum cinerariifolium]